MFKQLILLLVAVALLTIPQRADASFIAAIPDPRTYTVCPTGCQYNSLQAAANQPTSEPITVKVLGSLTGESARLNLGLLSQQPSLYIQCEQGVILDGAGASSIIDGQLTANFSLHNCTLQNVASSSSYLVNVVVKNGTFAKNTYVGSTVRVTPNIQSIHDSNTFINSQLATGIGLPKVYNNTFNNLAGVPNLTAIRLFPILTGDTQLYNNTINGYTTGVYFMNDKTFLVYNNLLANTALGFYASTPSVTVHTHNTLTHNVPVLRSGPGNGEDFAVFTGNPLFIDASLRIRWQSPAVDRGDKYLSPKVDKAGVARSDSPDIGAFEGSTY